MPHVIPPMDGPTEFDVFQDGESVDYIIEEGDSMGGDVVFSITYELGYI